MKNFKILAILSTLSIITVGLSGCNEEKQNSYAFNENSNSKNDTLIIDTVEVGRMMSRYEHESAVSVIKQDIGNGETVTCIWAITNRSGDGLSCNWDEVNKNK